MTTTVPKRNKIFSQRGAGAAGCTVLGEGFFSLGKGRDTMSFWQGGEGLGSAPRSRLGGEQTRGCYPEDSLLLLSFCPLTASPTMCEALLLRAAVEL